MLRGVMVLVVAAGLVVAATIGLTATVLPEGAPTTTTTPEAGRAPTGPPTEPGQRVEVTGDREGFLDPSDLFELGGDAETGLYVDRMIHEGMNIFLDPGDCPVEVDSVSLTTGLARLTLSCAGISDVQGNNTIDLEGWLVYNAVWVLPRPSEETGGNLTYQGDVEDDVSIGPMAWYVSADNPDIGVVQSLPSETSPLPFSLGLEASGDELRVTHVVIFDDFAPNEFPAGPDDCTVTTEVDQAVGDTERVEVTVECPELRDDHGSTISVSGSLLLDRITVAADG